ncbi:hypothetical protein OE88DRAFT_333644 [Heliocybe sulcata]|uniref:Uncharacterized protein n=1 Tax=Heliocybe sulcata TaxID=5364 RepID=A0A5C3N297_9AGAM|nr:hypothetical protein OE88DRAFT_333644 [Heliocybe sulcata]
MSTFFACQYLRGLLTPPASRLAKDTWSSFLSHRCWRRLAVTFAADPSLDCVGILRLPACRRNCPSGVKSDRVGVFHTTEPVPTFVLWLFLFNSPWNGVVGLPEILGRCPLSKHSVLSPAYQMALVSSARSVEHRISVFVPGSKETCSTARPLLFLCQTTV